MEAVVGELLMCERDPENASDRCAWPKVDIAEPATYEVASVSVERQHMEWRAL